MAEPVFIDLETRSDVDLRVAGGWNYAAGKNTKLLTVAWSSEEDRYDCWIPWCEDKKPTKRHHALPTAELLVTHLDGVTMHYGRKIPDALKLLTGRTWVAHNAWSFDQPVWEALVGDACRPVRWYDTYPMALAAGLPGGLNDIGMRLWGDGKYQEGSQIAKTATRWKRPADEPRGKNNPVDLPVPALVQVARYNVQDVRLLRWLWDELYRTLEIDGDEHRVLIAHRDINARGVKVDRPLLVALKKLAEDARGHAIVEINRLTEGEFKEVSDLRKRTKIFDWIKGLGIEIGGSLKKEIVTRLGEEVRDAEDRESEVKTGETRDDSDDLAPIVAPNLPLVVKVLELRQSALRIASSKIDVALASMGLDHRLRGLFVYWGAHTGRWAGRRVQVQNLPRPKEGVDVWRLLSHFDATGKLPYDFVRSSLAVGKQFRTLTVDDAVASLLRGAFLPDDGKLLAVADYSGIEARVLAWLAGEQWLMDAFWSGSDPYISTAERIYGPKESWPVYPDPENPGQPLPFKKHPYRQVGKIVELGSGYQLGVVKMALYAAGNGIDLEAVGTSAHAAVHAYRGSHPAIAGRIAGEYNGVPYYRGGFWEKLNSAAMAAVRDGVDVAVGGIGFGMRGKHLYVTLPSGRHLVYRHARVTMKPSKAMGGKVVETLDFLSPRFGRVDMYGGKWAENIVQATSRDFLAHAIVGLEEAGFPVVLHVHDEPASVVESPSQFPEFMRIMTTPPEWADGFPLDADGGLLHRYGKSLPPGPNGEKQKEELWRNGKRMK